MPVARIRHVASAAWLTLQPDQAQKPGRLIGVQQAGEFLLQALNDAPLGDVDGVFRDAEFLGDFVGGPCVGDGFQQAFHVSG